MVTYSELLKTITDNLRRRRESAKVTQENIARSLNVNRSTISRFENGEIDSIILYYRYITALAVLKHFTSRGDNNDVE